VIAACQQLRITDLRVTKKGRKRPHQKQILRIKKNLLLSFVFVLADNRKWLLVNSYWNQPTAINQ